MKSTAIVLAGGRGNRMQSDIPKQYIEINGKTLLHYTLKAFEESKTDEVVLVVGNGDEEYCRKTIVETGNFRKVVKIVSGGKERYDSVYEGLKVCEDSDFVLVHDGARCCLKRELIDEILVRVQEVNACIAAVPVKDTIKIADENGKIVQTPNRSGLWSVQTPQAFAYEIVRSAYDKMYAAMREETNASKWMITDDAMVVEHFSDTPVYLCDGDYTNIKVTTPEDLLLVESFLKRG